MFEHTVIWMPICKNGISQQPSIALPSSCPARFMSDFMVLVIWSRYYFTLCVLVKQSHSYKPFKSSTLLASAVMKLPPCVPFPKTMINTNSLFTLEWITRWFPETLTQIAFFQLQLFVLIQRIKISFKYHQSMRAFILLIFSPFCSLSKLRKSRLKTPMARFNNRLISQLLQCHVICSMTLEKLTQKGNYRLLFKTCVLS